MRASYTGVRGSPLPKRPHSPSCSHSYFTTLDLWSPNLLSISLATCGQSGDEKTKAAKIPSQASAPWHPGPRRGGDSTALMSLRSQFISLLGSEASFIGWGFFPLLMGPLHPAQHMLTASLPPSQPMTHEGRPRRSHFPLAGQSIPVFHLRPIGHRYFLSAYRILLPCMSTPRGCGKCTLAQQEKHHYTHFTGGKNEAQRGYWPRPHSESESQVGYLNFHESIYSTLT